jgi:hypothetical protein
MKWLGLAISCFLVTFLIASSVAADGEISCEDSLLEYTGASSRVRCYRYKEPQFVHDILIDSTSYDWIGIGLQKSGHRARLTAFHDPKAAMEFFFSDDDDPTFNWSQLKIAKTNDGRVLYQTFEIKEKICFAFLNHWSRSHVFVASQCRDSSAIGADEIGYLAKKLAESTSVRSD